MEQPIPNEPNRALIETIDRSIVQRGLYGKFHPGVLMHGQLLVDKESSDFTFYPSDFDWRKGKAKYLKKVGILADAISTIDAGGVPDEVAQLTRKHFFASVAVPDSNLDAVVMFFFHDHRDVASRPSRIAQVIFTMPRENARLLQDLIVQAPDAAELFFQTAAAGLERKAQGEPGVGRIVSDEIVILDTEKLVPDATLFDKGRELAEGNVSFMLKLKLAKLLPQNARRFHYSKPYGVANPKYL